MALSRITSLTDFAALAPPWQLTSLDQNSTNITSAFNDASLGYHNYIGTDSGSANNYQVTCLYGTPSAYNAGMTVSFLAAHSNTGASTLTVSPLGSLSITRPDGTALQGGEIVANVNVTLVCTGTSFVIVALPCASFQTNLGTVSTSQTVNCQNTYNIAVRVNFTASITLTLNNVAPAAQVVVVMANTGGVNNNFALAATLPGGSFYSSITTKLAGASSGFGTIWTGSGVSIISAVGFVITLQSFSGVLIGTHG